MANENYQICSNCVMDTTDPKNTFDEQGRCRHCNNFYSNIKPNWHTGEKGRKLIDPVIKAIKKEGKGKDFDCILGLSGGVDSSYLAHIAVKELGLRPLVFHVDAGWNSQTAVNNIQRLVDGLGLDLFTEVINWEEMKDLQLAFFKAGVDHIDTPQDHAFFATMYKYAAKYKIKYILNGGNYSTECIDNPLDWHYHASDLTQLKDIHSKFGTMKLDTFPLSNVLTYKIFYRYFKGVRVVKPLNFVEYNKQKAIDLLQGTYGWQPYPQKHFESRFTKFYEGYWQPKKFNVDKRRVQFSSLIVTEQMKREDALEALKKPAMSEDEARQEFEFVAKKLGITTEELQSYMDAPNKSYRDYKNQKGVFDLGMKIMIALGLYRNIDR